MDFKKLLTAPVHAGQSVLRDLTNTQPEQDAAKAEVMKMLAAQGAGDIAQFTPQQEQTPFELPGLDDALNEEALARKAEMEAVGEQFVPGEEDFVDSGPYGYLHKKAIHDALMEYEQELQANRPRIDYEGIMKKRMADLASAPEPHRTNPIYQFAMALGGGEHANELLKEHDEKEAEANIAQAQRWQTLLDMKKDALEGSVKQAMAEGEARKVVSGKWLEQLAQIEKDKAKLAGELDKQESKNLAAETRTRQRGEYALQVAEARGKAMLGARQIDASGALGRKILNDKRLLLMGLLKAGTQYADAVDQADDWMEDQLDTLEKQRGNVSPSGAGGGTTTPRAGATPSGNPLVDSVLTGRKKAGG